MLFQVSGMGLHICRLQGRLFAGYKADHLPVTCATNCRLHLHLVYAAVSKYASPSSFRRPDERDRPVPPCCGDVDCIHADSSNSRSFDGAERSSLISTGGSRHKLRNEAMKSRKKAPQKRGIFVLDRMQVSFEFRSVTLKHGGRSSIGSAESKSSIPRLRSLTNPQYFVGGLSAI
jgi:hypothetical protein